MHRLRLLALLAPLAGCANASSGCRPAEARVENASSLALEQLYLAPAGQAWGPNQISRADLPSRETLPVRFAGAGPYALRVVWVDGRAAELRGIDGCIIRRITILDGALQAE